MMFGELTERMRDFREELLSQQPHVCAERAIITTEIYRANMDQSLAIRRALMYKNVLERMSIYIEKQTLIAGNQASGNRFAPIFPEYAMDWVIAELDEFDKRPG
ncbi:MAG: formate C-acetyltransferase/glycerol dehydratase family glycyl radical enzyme, partial [Treponema sp.]|nr:formate C-acetyltransferase/glycerol dehydratase family glycyl radical enzyme [Treponema sp.]